MLKRLATSIFPILPALRGKFEKKWTDANKIGLLAAARLWIAKNIQSRLRTNRLAKVELVGLEHPLYFRPCSSDPLVIHQLFVKREYEAVASLEGIEFIVDCGANIGCATFYLLHFYRKARAIVVEPDAGNMAICRKNLAPFADRVTFVQAGVWSSRSSLIVERGQFRNGGEWGFRVRPALSGEKPDVQAVAIPDLMADAGFPRIDLLKIDIEGSEKELFSPLRTPASERIVIDPDMWLPEVRNLAIEVHGDDCERAFRDALQKYHFEESHSGELIILQMLVRISESVNLGEVHAN